MTSSRSIAGTVLLASLALAACDASSSSSSCASKEEIAQTVSSLSDDLQKADASGKLERVKTAEAMGRMLTASQAFAANHDRTAYCTALVKIRKDAGL